MAGLRRTLGFGSLTFYGVGLILGAGIYSILTSASATLMACTRASRGVMRQALLILVALVLAGCLGQDVEPVASAGAREFRTRSHNEARDPIA